MAEERGEKLAAELVREGQDLADTILVPVRSSTRGSARVSVYANLTAEFLWDLRCAETAALLR